MKVVGVIGTGGVGKSAVTSLLSLGFSYRARESGSLVAAVDGDVTEALLTKMLLGERENLKSLNELLFGVVSPEETIYEPVLAVDDPKVRKKLPTLSNLRVVPASQAHVEELKVIPLQSMVQRLWQLEDTLSSLGASVAVVDFPPGDPALANFSTALAWWVDAVIAVVTPSRRRIAATAYACQILRENGVKTLAVVLNKYSDAEPFDEYGNRWEDVVRQYFAQDPIIVPEDRDLSRLMVMDVIPLAQIPALQSARALARASASLWRAVLELEERPRSPPAEEAKLREAIPEAIPEARDLDRELAELFLGEEAEPVAYREKESAPSRAPRAVVPKPVLREERPKPKESEGVLSKVLKRLRGGSVTLIYPDGARERVKRALLQEALIAAGLPEDRVSKLLSGEEIDLSRLRDEEERLAVDAALVYAGLRPVGELR